MKRTKVIAVFLLLMVCSALVAAPRPVLHARGDRGSVVIRTLSADRIVVLLDTRVDGVQDGRIDQWYTLQLDAPIAAINTYIPAAEILYRRDSLRVTAAAERTVYDFLLADSEPVPAVPEGFASVRHEGFGLAHNSGITSYELAPSRSRSGGVASMEEGCAYCDPMNQDWSAGGTSSGSATCTAGGSGAHSCSMSAGGYTCSISCNPGNYACCSITSTNGVVCRCYKG